MKEHMSWYKKVLKKNTKEAALSAAFAVVFALAVLLWHFAFTKAENFTFELITRGTTQLSQPLQKALSETKSILKKILP